MQDPNAYPELILDSAQDKIRALARQQAREQARQRARRAAKAAGRRSRSGTWSWRRSRVRRPPEAAD